MIFKISLMTFLLFSSSVFASVCEVVMVENYTRRILDRFREYDYDNSCRESMKECKKALRLTGWYDRAECEIVSDRNPSPRTDYAPDATRFLNAGEVVIFNNQFATVTEVERGNLYSINYNDNWRSSHRRIPREYLAVTSGCIPVRGRNLCAGHQVIMRNNQYAVVVGLQYNLKVILRLLDGRGILLSDMDPYDLVITR
jgi:hypothetical protein